jgi:hypothetical protein
MMVQHHRGGSATPEHIKTGNASLFCSHRVLRGKREKSRTHSTVITLKERWPDGDNG